MPIYSEHLHAISFKIYPYVILMFHYNERQIEPVFVHRETVQSISLKISKLFKCLPNNYYQLFLHPVL